MKIDSRAVIAVIALSSLVLAADPSAAVNESICKGINLMRMVIGGLAVLAIMWQGARLIPFSGGEVSAEDRNEAKKNIIYIIAAAVIIALAPAIVGYFVQGVPSC